MSDFQISDLVRFKRTIGVIRTLSFGVHSLAGTETASIHQRPDSDFRILISCDDLHKIAPLTIEDLRSHDFSQGNLQLWQASAYGLTELSVHSWKFEQAEWGQQLSLCEHRATRTFGPTLKGIEALYLNKDDAIASSAWMLREQQAERRKQIADLEQQERKMLAGLEL